MKSLIMKALLISLLLANTVFASDPLPSWNDTAQKKSIITFVEEVTKEGSPNFVPVAERIATFDNDGTLWPEQPMYFPQAFTFDRIKALAPQHPEWKNNPAFKKVLEGNMQTVSASGSSTIGLELELAMHANYTTEEFSQFVKDWVTTAKHPTTGRLYTEMVYQPMLELLTYLRSNGFKTFIVSGGWIDFMRPWAEKAYGIPPEQIIGSNVKLKLELRDDKPVLVYLPKLNLANDGECKVFSIHRKIGYRPIVAFGNSDGDLQMLQWVAAGSGLRLAALVHHTDAKREWAYDRKSSYGRLDKALDEAHAKGWSIVDMKKDWKVIYAFEKK